MSSRYRIEAAETYSADIADSEELYEFHETCDSDALESSSAPLVEASPTPACSADTILPQAEQSHAPSTLRMALLSIGTLALMFGMGVRVLQLQLSQSADLSSRVENQSLWSEPVVAQPGDLISRDGYVMATSIPTKSLFADPSRMEHPEEVAHLLAQVLSQSESELLEKFVRQKDRQFVWLQRRIDPDLSAAIEDLNLDRQAVSFRTEYRRVHPLGPVAGHVLGLRNLEGAGRGGLEQHLEEQITGTNGIRHFERDAYGRMIEVQHQADQTAKHGLDVELTIDTSLQMMCETVLEKTAEQWNPQSACAIVLDPHNGDVLALSSWPFFNPDSPPGPNHQGWQNCAITCLIEPGSTVKPLILSAALQQNAIEKEDQLFCHQGVYQMGRRRLHDHHPYGWLSLTDVIVKSSNIGMAQIGERLGNEQLHQTLLHYGFGRPTGIETPGELTGLVRPLKMWNHYSTGSVPMGHEFSVTPLQLAAATCTLANHGIAHPPRLVKSIDGHGMMTSRISSRVVDAEIADWIVQGPMREVVVRGTGRRANLEGMELFGKTGTSQKYDAAMGAYSKTKSVCSFVCGAPASNPELVVVVCVDEPTSGSGWGGGSVAAPAAAEIMKKALPYWQGSE